MSGPTLLEPGPYDLEPRGATTGDAVLCIHGLTGTPYEVRPMAEALAERGLRARGPLLPGHGGTPEELARISYPEWIDAVRREHAALRAEHERVFVCGLSLGGLLALWLAANEKVDAVAVVGTPLRFRGAIPVLVALGRFLWPMMQKRGGSDIADEIARDRHPSLPVMPLASVHQLIRLQRIVRRGLPDVRAPLFAAHGALDTTADPADLDGITENVGSARVERRVFERSGHIVPVDYDGAELSAAVADFFANHPRS